MRLDFVDQDDAQKECNRIVRLYDFDTVEVEQFRSQCVDLAMGLRSVVAVHELPFVTALGSCGLFMRVSQQDYGIRPQTVSGVFDCDVAVETWAKIAWFLEVYLTEADVRTFHWLDETFQWTEETSDICFLFTPHPDGYW